MPRFPIFGNETNYGTWKRDELYLINLNNFHSVTRGVSRFSHVPRRRPTGGKLTKEEGKDPDQKFNKKSK